MMYQSVDKISNNKQKSLDDNLVTRQTGGSTSLTLPDKRASSVIQRKLTDSINNSLIRKHGGIIQKKKGIFSQAEQPEIKVNKTGLPDQLKSGIEHLSGYSMNDVKVHYNSNKPAQFEAHAYAQGTDIHIAPGQEKHLPHEAWHVAQQKQGRVKPTVQMKGNIHINNDKGLEREADNMGAKAGSSFVTGKAMTAKKHGHVETKIVQRAWWYLNSLNLLSQNPEPDDVTRDVAVNYIKRVYPDVHRIYSLAYDVAIVNTANGWVMLPLRRELPRAGGLAQTQSATASAATAQPQQLATEEEPLGELQKGLSVDGVRDKLFKLLTAMAAIYLPAYIAWETYKSRRGQHAGGGTGHVSQALISKLDALFETCHTNLHALKAAYQKPVLEGFKMGLHPAPMPVAEEYANFEELVRGFFQLSYLMLANKEDIDALIKGGADGHVAVSAANRKEKEEGAGSASSDRSILNKVTGGRNQLMKGYMAGSVTNSIIFSFLNSGGFAHPIMNLQMPWDAFHVLNAYAIRAAQLRDQENSALHAVVRERMRMQRIQQELHFELLQARIRAFALHHNRQAQPHGQRIQLPAQQVEQRVRPVQPPQQVQVPVGPINLAQRRMEQEGRRLLFTKIPDLITKLLFRR